MRSGMYGPPRQLTTNRRCTHGGVIRTGILGQKRIGKRVVPRNSKEFPGRWPVTFSQRRHGQGLGLGEVAHGALLWIRLRRCCYSKGRECDPTHAALRHEWGTRPRSLFAMLTSLLCYSYPTNHDQTIARPSARRGLHLGRRTGLCRRLRFAQIRSVA